MKTIRFGVIGTNVITDQFIAGARAVEGVSIEAVYSRTQERGDAFAAKYDLPHTFIDLEEMAKSDVIDAVYIASPNALHCNQALIFLNHKKHVLCEKALASHTGEVKVMIEAAKKNGVILMEAIKTLSLPNFKVVKDHLHRIGKIRKYFGSYCQYSSRYNAFKEGTVLNAFKPELSNGALVDIGVYCIAPMVALFGKPQTVQATGYMLSTGVDGEGTLICGYEDLSATIMYSKISDSNLASELQGEEGSIRIEHINTFNKITLSLRTGEEIDLTEIQKQDDLCYEIQNFVELIRNKDMERMGKWLQYSYDVVAIMEEARRQIGVIYPADATNI